MTQALTRSLGTVPLASRRATTRLGRVLADALVPGDLVLLEGPLGVGKTFLARAILRGLGLPSDARVTSPTFALVRDYNGRFPVLHADLYRLGQAEELGPLGLRERRGDGAIVIVEWGEAYADELGGDAFSVTLSVDERGLRSAEVVVADRITPRADVLAQALQGLLSCFARSRTRR